MKELIKNKLVNLCIVLSATTRANEMDVTFKLFDIIALYSLVPVHVFRPKLIPD